MILIPTRITIGNVIPSKIGGKDTLGELAIFAEVARSANNEFIPLVGMAPSILLRPPSVNRLDLRVPYQEETKVKVKSLPVGLLSIPALLFGTLSWVSPTAAQCVMADTSVQVAIRGSRQPSQQENNVNMESQGPCSGNAVTQTSTQVYTGPGSARQIRNSHQTVSGETENSTGIDGPTVKAPVGVQVDVYNPAYDPDFMNGVRSHH